MSKVTERLLDETLVENVTSDIQSQLNVKATIDDTTPQATSVFSSSKTQALYEANATAIGNLSGASASFYSNTAVVVPEAPVAMIDLTWTTSQVSSNSTLFELGVNEVSFKKDGKYTFLNTLTFNRLSDGSPVTVTFELYDADTTTVLGIFTQALDMTAGTKETIPMNAVIPIVGATALDPIRMKVRMQATSANGTIELFSFNSILAAQAIVEATAGGVTDHTLLTNIGINTHAQIDNALGRLANTSGANTGDQTSVTGNAGTATLLQTARTINGVSFNGGSDITINATDSTARVAVSSLGAANGVATLDATGKIPVGQMPTGITIDDVVAMAIALG